MNDETCEWCGGFGFLTGDLLDVPQACDVCGTLGPGGVAEEAEACPECDEETSSE